MRKTTNSELIKLGPDEEMEDRSLNNRWNEAYDENPFQNESLTLRTRIKTPSEVPFSWLY